MSKYNYIKWFDEIGKEDVGIVGGKGANLGELTSFGLPVPPGFCVTAEAYTKFIKYAELDEVVKFLMEAVDVENVDDLTNVSKEIQTKIKEKDFDPELEEEILRAYREFSEDIGVKDPEVAVRSSATAEDLPDASFAGQQDTYLHISGEEELLNHIRDCFASLWTSRAIYYREKQNYDHFDVALSVVIQKMVNSEKSGVMFTANPINNSTDEMMINASYGLGEAVVSGIVTPDEYIIDKKTKKVIEKNISEKEYMVIKNENGVGTRTVNVKDVLGEDAIKAEALSPEELDTLIERGLKVEKLYGSVQDTEWGFDTDTKEFYFLQSRPITTLEEKKEEKLVTLCKGLPASPGIGRGKVKLIKDISEINLVEEGDVLVTAMTNPDMVPAMRKCAGVVTDEGGRTCHAAIVSRELQIPCIVGAKNATKSLKTGDTVTVDAVRGIVYDGEVLKEKEEKKTESQSSGPSLGNIDELRHIFAPTTATKIYMNLGEPGLIDKYKNLPMDGIGLMRTEFIFTNMIGAHPMYLVKTGQGDLMVDKLAEGISKVAQAIYPKNLVVRTSDFRTNEFRGLKGGDEVEPIEANPMIGWRGVSRYISPEYEKGFRLECQAIKKVREEYGLTNVIVMLPFVRTPQELKVVKGIMAEEGLVQSKNFKIWIMAEVPAVVLQAEEFAELVDGFSIGSNDLTQLVMGADRDSGILNNMGYFDERNDAVKIALKTIIDAANKKGITCSICGQGPSQYPELAEFLVECGITSMSVNPDTVDYTRRLVASVEQKIILKKLRQM
ncbi:MAG: phosphoenolpyruvate synthase [Peptoniphilus harei]|uniref:phosphoenolpyruvate synthase n=1 Tax=Peptoniphilus TaxID=162289 RepID=UPI0011DD628A|nr:phosphoenolpyruvate synthase [Peptoniphilus harei]MDK7755120.1 phosphoenolpyruvate synthase [Peptoniphilus harei]MDK7760927.1 phosphoenolpyruvate synthase [Peptoniphilus harei]MDK8270717.1 phosphoenolpyruvate synthase [Peptoniphilus harei]MDK8339100.1 phosphoenolpyruvate synthase [Peptoniphilus harei]MDU5323918.1 phosphoenolpyruvate synthase [Peptoniphilus harei]